MRGARFDLELAVTLERALGNYPDIQYCMYPGRNGGVYPLAKDCASDWQDKKGRHYRTSDCVGFALWCLGLDRYQPGLNDWPAFPLYGGWINTTSMLLEARNPREGNRWFQESPRPSVGSLVCFPSYRRLGRLRPGHVGVVVGVPSEWDSRARECWRALSVAHCHGPAFHGPAIDRSHSDSWRAHWKPNGTGTGFLTLIK